MPDGYLHLHQQLQAEWANATAWPKHLLVEYTWLERHEVNATPGLYVLITTCERAPFPAPLLRPSAPKSRGQGCPGACAAAWLWRRPTPPRALLSKLF